MIACGIGSLRKYFDLLQLDLGTVMASAPIEFRDRDVEQCLHLHYGILSLLALAIQYQDASTFTIEGLGTDFWFTQIERYLQPNGNLYYWTTVIPCDSPIFSLFQVLVTRLVILVAVCNTSLCSPVYTGWWFCTHD